MQCFNFSVYRERALFPTAALLPCISLQLVGNHSHNKQSDVT